MIPHYYHLKLKHFKTEQNNCGKPFGFPLPVEGEFMCFREKSKYSKPVGTAIVKPCTTRGFHSGWKSESIYGMVKIKKPQYVVV